ncbi:MAG: PAS domain S-box protein [Opitutaceae bacterium]|nr:PAS domain S-box protein [Opitutaceae bacterium]
MSPPAAAAKSTPRGAREAPKSPNGPSADPFADLFEFAPISYVTLGPDGMVRRANLASADLIGAARDLWVGQHFVTLLAAPYRLPFLTFLERAFAQRSLVTELFELKAFGRPSRFIRCKAQSCPGELECRLVMVDRTDQVRVEEKVRVSETRYRRLFEAAHDGVLLMDPTTRKITDANPFMTRLLGYSSKELLGKELFEIGLLKDETASQEMFRKLKRNRQVRYEDLPLESRDGRHQEVEVVANLYLEGGVPVIQCNIRDITARKDAERVLRRNESLFSALVAQAPVGVYVVDAAFRMQQLNPLAQKIFGAIQPLIGRDFNEVVHVLWPPKVAVRIASTFRHTLKTGEPYQTLTFAERRRDLGVTQDYEWQLQRVTLPTGEFGVVCFFNDVTQRKQAERARRRLDVMTASNVKLKREISKRLRVERSLRTSEQTARRLLAKARSLQDSVRDISHQMVLDEENQRREISRELHDKISQLLIGILVQLSVFTQAATVEPAGIRTAVAPLRRLVARSVRVVHRFARELRPAMLDDLGLIPAVRAYIEDMPKRKGRTIHFTAHAAVETLDNERRTVLFRVVQEALVNVSKHARARETHVTITRLRSGIRLEVMDNGMAFDVERLSSPKWKQRLGLIGMRERVEMVGGRFSVESSPGKGTTVRSDVPFASPAPRLQARVSTTRSRRKSEQLFTPWEQPSPT